MSLDADEIRKRFGPGSLDPTNLRTLWPGEPEEPEVVDCDVADPRHLTDVGNGARLVQVAAGDWFITRESRRWHHRLRSGLVQPDHEGAILRLAVRAAQTRYADVPAGDEHAEARERILRWIRSSQSVSRLKAAVEVAAFLPGMTVPDAELDADPWLLGTPGGVVDLRTRRLLEVAPPDAYVTKTTGARWDPDALAPLWLKFLRRVQPDQAERDYLQRWCGYLLSGSVREHALLLLLGEGSNGKSVFIRAIQHVLGDYAVTAPPELLLAKYGTDHPTELARLQGARAAFTVEVEEGRRWNESRLKQLTGGDVISARVMRGDWFDYKPSAKLLIAANHSPQVRGIDHGVWRRMRVLRFPTTIPDHEQDKRLPEKLRAEAAGILQWMADGLQQWQTEGLAEPDSVRGAVSEYKAAQDWCGGFLRDCCVEAPAFRVGSTPLLEAAQSWCEANGHEKPSAKLLANRLKERGFTNGQFTSGPNKGRSAWHGLTLKAQE